MVGKETTIRQSSNGVEINTYGQRTVFISIQLLKIKHGSDDHT